MLTFQILLPPKEHLVATLRETCAFTFKKSIAAKDVEDSELSKKRNIFSSHSSVCALEK